LDCGCSGREILRQQLSRLSVFGVGFEGRRRRPSGGGGGGDQAAMSRKSGSDTILAKAVFRVERRTLQGVGFVLI
jgi:hypothetical protein